MNFRSTLTLATSYALAFCGVQTHAALILQSSAPTTGPVAAAPEIRTLQPQPELDIPDAPTPVVRREKRARKLPATPAAPMGPQFVAPAQPPLRAALFGSSLAAAPELVTLGTGSATIDYHKSGWDALAAGLGGPNVLTIDEFFDLSAITAMNYTQILRDEVQATPSYTEQVYPMNGETVFNITTPLPGRTNQPTTFSFPRGNAQGHTGSIGIAGISRFAAAESVGGGKLLYGDFTIQYDPDRIELGGSGWYLKGNIAPTAAAFDILNVSVVETATTLTISGDLGVSFEVANLLYNTPDDAGRDVGDFTFTASIVPEPGSATLLLTGFAAIATRRRTRK